MKKEYVYGGGMMATIEPSIGTQYATTDLLGSPRAITDSNSNVVSRHDYMPFGEEIFAGTGGRTAGQGYGGAETLRKKFTSKERDNETGLDYFGARYYGSTLGRFMSVDPLNPILGRQESSNQKAAEKEFRRYLKQPQNWNRYIYALNNPLRYIDPDGFQPITVKINIIFDKDSKYTDEEKKQFRDTYVAELQKDFKDVDINFEVTYTEGTATNTADHNKHEMKEGVASGSINVFATKGKVGPSTEVSNYSKGEVWLNTKDGVQGNLTHGVIHVLGITGGVNGYTKQDNSSHDRFQLIFNEIHTRLFGNSAESATQAIQNHLHLVANDGYTFYGGFGQAKAGLPPTKLPQPNFSKEYGFLREGAKRFEKK